MGVRTFTRYFRRGALLTVAGVVFLGGCSADTPTLSFPDAPDKVSVPDGDEVERVTFRHTSGVTLDGTVEDGLAQPPLLIDGEWVIELGGKQVGTLKVGQDVDADATGDALLSCWIGSGPEKPRSPTPDGVRCTQSLVLGVALKHGYTRAEALIETARDGLGADRNLWGWYCGIAGDAAAMGAVLGGADGRTLIREEKSFCDYSILHGVGAAAVLLHANDPLPAVRIVCAPDPRADMPEISRTSQCWHGAGIGLARTTRLDLLSGERICAQAVDESSRLNCLEGFFSFTRTYRLRGEDAQRNWPGLTVDGATCSTLPPSFELLAMCYRSSAQMLIYDTSQHHTESGEARRVAVGAMLTTCEAVEGDPASACWYGLGTLVASSLHPDLHDVPEIERWFNVCSDAPSEEALLLCYERASFGLVRNDQLVNGLDIDTLTALLPEDVRGELRTKIINWSQTLGGRSN